MGADSRDVPGLEDDDLVCMAYGRDALGDDHLRDARAPRGKGVAKPGIRREVKRRARVVQDEDPRRPGEGTSDREPLPLAAGEVSAQLLDGSLEPSLCGYYVLCLRGLDAACQLLHGGILVCEPQVGLDRAREQRGALVNECHEPMERCEGKLAHVVAAERHDALGWVVEAHEEACERGLARARSPDDAQHLARRHGQAHVCERGCRGAGIGKGDVP